ncbi:MAG TPA: hypothetical protein PLN63_03545 [Paludibacteraceae bacterium]|jgi:hypothetical protein|nr:hypothetical protein [Paludibacteraceae bacterium]HPH62679.1 hypothetical protein [Paludibacteraceae bacterium]
MVQYLKIYYSTNVSKWMSSPDYGMQEMSDAYVLDEICLELQKKQG